MSSLKIPKARLVGTGEHVDLADYDPERHRNCLQCFDCSARVHFNAGASVVGGQPSLYGTRPHFKTNPGQNHDSGCLIRLFMGESEPAEGYDPQAGFRIHLNMEECASLFNGRSSLYARDDKGRVRLKKGYEALRVKRPLSTKSVEDLRNLINKTDWELLAKSVVVRGNLVLRWEHFFASTDESYRIFTRRLLKQKIKGQLALLHVRLSGQAHGGRVRPAEIYGAMDKRGRDHWIRPRVYLDSQRVRGQMRESGDYLAFGYVRPYSIANDNGVHHFLNMSVTNPAQLLRKPVAPH